MRLLKKNQQELWYALQSKNKAPIYDYYVGTDGIEYPVETGEYDYTYSAPKKFEGNIASSGSKAEAVEYGLNLADYEAVLIVDKDSVPITETSLVWQNTKPQTNKDGTADKTTADYTVVKVAPSLDSDKYILKKVVK